MVRRLFVCTYLVPAGMAWQSEFIEIINQTNWLTWFWRDGIALAYKDQAY